MNALANETCFTVITAFFFVDFPGSIFIAPFAFGLYPYRIRFLWFFLFKTKVDGFQKKNEQLSHSCYRLLPPLFQGKSFLVDTYIFVVEYSFKSFDTRKQLFRIQ